MVTSANYICLDGNGKLEFFLIYGLAWICLDGNGKFDFLAAKTQLNKS